MKLNYRGVTYEHNPTEFTVAEGQVGGKFRGRSWRVHNLKDVPLVKHATDLVYRGVRVK